MSDVFSDLAGQVLAAGGGSAQAAIQPVLPAWFAPAPVPLSDPPTEMIVEMAEGDPQAFKSPGENVPVSFFPDPSPDFNQINPLLSPFKRSPDRLSLSENGDQLDLMSIHPGLPFRDTDMLPGDTLLDTGSSAPILPPPAAGIPTQIKLTLPVDRKLKSSNQGSPGDVRLPRSARRDSMSAASTKQAKEENRTSDFNSRGGVKMPRPAPQFQSDPPKKNPPAARRSAQLPAEPEKAADPAGFEDSWIDRAIRPESTQKMAGQPQPVFSVRFSAVRQGNLPSPRAQSAFMAQAWRSTPDRLKRQMPLPSLFNAAPTFQAVVDQTSVMPESQGLAQISTAIRGSAAAKPDVTSSATNPQKVSTAITPRLIPAPAPSAQPPLSKMDAAGTAPIPGAGQTPRAKLAETGAPAIHVSIGRVEVRASVTPPVQHGAQHSGVLPAISLEEYLKLRKGERK
jgi:hypothetical protein